MPMTKGVPGKVSVRGKGERASKIDQTKTMVAVS